MVDAGRPTSPSSETSVVVIGASAGGPRALQAILPALPPSFSGAVIVVQHFTRELFDSWMQTLSQACRLPVEKAHDGSTLAPGVVTVCPPEHQFTVSRVGGRLCGHLQPDATSTYKPSIDTTMSSFARVCGAATVGVLLTGMGEDGVEGLRRIIETGGLTIVESEETAAVSGMPGAAVRAGVAQRVLPLNQIASELIMTIETRKRAPERAAMGFADQSSSGRSLDVERLIAQGDRAAVRELVLLLEASRPILVESAKRALQTMPAELVLPELVPLLSSDAPVVRATAVEIGKRIRVEHPEVIRLLSELCNDSDDDLRLFALDIVSAHNPTGLLDVVLERCDDPNINVAIMAIKALGGYDSASAVGRLVEAFRSDSGPREAAIASLGRSPAPEATGHLCDFVPESFEDRYTWLHAIAKRTGAAAVMSVVEALDTLPATLLPQALSSLARLCRESREALPAKVFRRVRGLPFAEYLADGRERVRAGAIRIIGAVGNDALMTILVEHFDDMTGEERQLALESLAEMPNENGAEVLLMLSESDDAAVAAKALEFVRSL